MPSGLGAWTSARPHVPQRLITPNRKRRTFLRRRHVPIFISPIKQSATPTITAGRHGLDKTVRNRLGHTFNADKTVRQTFTNRPNSEDLRLNFDGQLVPSVTNHKHLGLNQSNDLHFHQHTKKSLIRTVTHFLGPIYPIAKLLPRSTLNEIYMTYIRPHFDYCDIIYDGNITSADSIRLQILQKSMRETRDWNPIQNTDWRTT